MADIINGEIINFGQSGIETTNRDNILNYLITEFKAIYGENAYIGIGTEDYNQLSLLADIFNDMGVTAVQVGNGYNLTSATGYQLDNIASIFYGNIQRKQGTASTIVVTLTGDVGTTINNGRLIDSLGGIWNLPSVVTFVSTQVSVEATYSQLGAYFITQSQLQGSSAIATPVTGWSNVQATEDAVVGTGLQSDNSFRADLAILANKEQSTTIDGLLSSMLTLQDTSGNPLIQKASIWNNDTANPQDYTNVSLTGIPARSICLSLLPSSGVEFVSGGSPTANGNLVAKTIYLNKNSGCGTYSGSNSGTQVNIPVSSQSSGEATSNFSTTIGFAQAEATNLYVAVVLTLGSAVTELPDSDTQTAITTAVQNIVAEQAIGANIYKAILFEPVLQALSDTVGATAYAISNIVISSTPLTEVDEVQSAENTNNIQMTYYQSAVVPTVTFFTTEQIG